MAIRTRKFLRLKPGRIHKFKIKATSFSGKSGWSDILPIRTSDVGAIDWTTSNYVEAIKAVPKFWLRHIRVTWAAIGQPLRFQNYYLFRYNFTLGNSGTGGGTTERDALIVSSGEYIDQGIGDEHPNFLKDTGRLPLYIDKISEDADSVAAGDNNAIKENRYDYWVWAIDKNEEKSANYLGPDNAEFGKPTTPELIVPSEYTKFGIDPANETDFCNTSVHDINKFWGDVQIAWQCVDGAEHYLVQFKRKGALLSLWSLPMMVEHNTTTGSWYAGAPNNIDDVQNAVIPNLVTNTTYLFRVKAVNVPIALVSGWSAAGEYYVERDPYPPAEVEDVSCRRLRHFAAGGILSEKGEHIKVDWKRPTLALLREQIDFYKIYRLPPVNTSLSLTGTDEDAVTLMGMINSYDPDAQDYLIYQNQQFIGSEYIDDDVLPLPEGGGGGLSFTWGCEGADDTARSTATYSTGGTVVGTMQGGVTYTSIYKHTGTYGLHVQLSENNVKFDNTTTQVFNGSAGFLDFWYYPNGDSTLKRTLFEANVNGQFEDLFEIAETTILYVEHAGESGGWSKLTATSAPTTWNQWIWHRIRVRWDVATDTLDLQVDEDGWVNSTDPTVMHHFDNEPANFEWGNSGWNANQYYLDDITMYNNFEGVAGAPDVNYHYFVTATEKYDNPNFGDPGEPEFLEQESVASIVGETITKADDDRYDGESGTGESHDIVSFGKPDAPVLISPLVSTDLGINLVHILIKKRYSIQFKWTDIPEATYYRVSVRVTPPEGLFITWPQTPWFTSARIDQALANRDSDDENPVWNYPLTLEQGALVEWKVVSGNLAGESETDPVEFEIVSDTTPPSKVTGVAGNCFGIGAPLGSLQLWLAVNLSWDALPNGEGVKEYKVYEDGTSENHVINSFNHNIAAGALGLKMRRSILIRPNGTSHTYYVGAVDEQGTAGDLSDPAVVPYEQWWVL
jgi:hypothetical protein